MLDQTKPADVSLIYDGDCPFCRNFIGLVRLRDSVGPVRLIDARGDAPMVQSVLEQGYDLNTGMVMIQGNLIYHGADCIHRIALMSTRSGLFNRLNAAIFRSATVSRVLYPVLRAGRNAALALLGKSQI